jgi:GGDEF domain-containing protein
MENKLKTITENTLLKLVGRDVILPSSYFQTFKETSEEVGVDVENNEFYKEVNETLEKDIQKLNSLIDKTLNNMNKLASETSKAQEAIHTNDSVGLEDISKEVNFLQKELFELMDQMYIDSETNNKNRKWLYHKYLNDKDTLHSDGLIVYINLINIKQIIDEHGELISSNVVKYVSGVLNVRFSEEQIEYKMVRYTTDKFIILVNNKSIDIIQNLFNKIRKKIISTTLKSNSGILLHPEMSFGICGYKNGDSFQSTLEIINALEEEDRKSLEI